MLEQEQLNLQLLKAEQQQRRINQQIAEEGAVYPSLENLAGRLYTNHLKRAYRHGGRFDFGIGRGPLGQDARALELAQYQQRWDRTYLPATGDYFNQHTLQGEHYDRNVQINADKERVRQLRLAISAAGGATPEMNLQTLADNSTDIAQTISILKQKGAINVSIANVKEP